MEFGEWLCREVVKAVPHRHVVLSIPKILRRYFLYDRKLLSDLSRCGWESLILCPKCSSEMRVIAVIEDSDVIKKILKHLGLRDVRRKPRPTANAPPIDAFPTYDEQPGPSADNYIRDPDYHAEACFQEKS